MAAKSTSSEVHAYKFILENLKELGWDTRNPSRHAGGQVWTQNECLQHSELKTYLGLDKPENVVKVSETIFWVIESKTEHKQLNQAVKEATEYADKINKGKIVKAAFITGVAGNPTDNYLTQTLYLIDGKFQPVTINGQKASALIGPDVIRDILETGNPNIKDVPVNETQFLVKAEKINQGLHQGAINKNSRARVIAAILLSLLEGTPDTDAPPSVLISDINARAKRVLKSQGKEDFFKYIEIAPPPSEDNHVKFKKALVDTIQQLLLLNIRSAMNSGTDVLGKFYEVFLKYGNGAKEIGIVLTPRHITKFAVEVLGVSDRDIVYDPTCGTAGFLVAAFDNVKQNHNEEQVNRFKQHNLMGVEQEAEVVALALVNMIFRGDGKNNIIEGDCFQKYIAKTSEGAKYVKVSPKKEDLAVTRVFMNPPFALRESDQKEYKFVEHALDQMVDSGLLFAVLPYSAMVKPGGYLEWRTRLLEKHTLLSVVTLPEDLFYPVGVHSVGVFIKKGFSHPVEQQVLWVRALNDGLLKSKGKRRPNSKATNDYLKLGTLLKAFVSSPALEVANKPRLQKAAPIDFTDPLLELVSENYLDEAPPTEVEMVGYVDQVIRDTFAFLILTSKEGEGE